MTGSSPEAPLGAKEKKEKHWSHEFDSDFSGSFLLLFFGGGVQSSKSANGGVSL